MGVQTQGGRDGQNGPPIISVFFSEETMREGLGVAVGVLTLLSRSEARAKAAERAAARDASVSFRVAMPPPIRAVARGLFIFQIAHPSHPRHPLDR